MWRQMKPLDWAQFVNKHVRVTANEKQQHEGWVYTVDPVSASIVLVTFPDAAQSAQSSVRVVMGQAVEEVLVLDRGSEETTARLRTAFTPRGAEALGADELKRRRESLRLWLQRNHVPVEVEGDTLRVANVLTVSAPYGVEDCSGPNEIILARVQGLVERNPGPDQPTSA